MKNERGGEELEKMIEVKHLSKSYGSKLSPVKALDNISFTVEEGEFVGIMGPSGAGKTTLMNILSTINLPTMGSVSIQGKEITKMKNSELSDFRRKKLLTASLYSIHFSSSANRRLHVYYFLKELSSCPSSDNFRKNHTIFNK